MSAVSNIYRAGSAVRNHMEREVLSDYDLSWVAFTVLWVLWIWGDQETGHVASEAGVTKGTLTGVIKTLAARRLVRRIPHRDDRRRVSIGLTRAGTALIEEIFPIFNRHETVAVASLSAPACGRKNLHRVAALGFGTTDCSRRQLQHGMSGEAR